MSNWDKYLLGIILYLISDFNNKKFIKRKKPAKARKNKNIID
jgi:hypothetical protein